MKNNKSFQVALGGVCGALAILCMLVTAVVPVLDFAMPAVAGGLMAIIVIEISKKWAFLTYIAVSITAMLIVPSKEVGLLFVIFLGYYPILKSVFEGIKKYCLQWAFKVVFFNISMVAFYFISAKLVTNGELMSDAEEISKYGMGVLLLLANVVFVVYDIALTRVISMYINWFRKKYLRRF